MNRETSESVRKGDKLMTPLFKKLNLGDHRKVLVLNGPESFEAELQLLEDVDVFRKTKRGREIGFAIYFVTTLKGIATAAKTLSEAPDDPVIWFAYPKERRKSTTANSTATTAGMRSAKLVSRVFDRSRSTKTGQL